MLLLETNVSTTCVEVIFGVNGRSDMRFVFIALA